MSQIPSLFTTEPPTHSIVGAVTRARRTALSDLHLLRLLDRPDAPRVGRRTTRADLAAYLDGVSGLNEAQISGFLSDLVWPSRG